MAQAVVSLTTPRPRFVLSISDPSATVVVVPALLCELTSSPATQVSQAIEAVRTPGSLTRWVVFGYEGNTGKLKVVEVVYTNHNFKYWLVNAIAAHHGQCGAMDADGKFAFTFCAQTGDGDLEELVDELNPGKVLYAYW